ncbi:hypothetical protein IE077_000354 [Cardiosporidium cionae]|uniref:Uncharacterized protein n=1 Tax=Cardiosporidium cionae TaxID=476202 RepID=A0ABQ7JAP4_9APIC|nr:hypothetical protein IE077_000354 [Cardiosporidium cionae]|eukprot:KAF8821078.1 hypothetical protein IE077_000354 [Cardiosporidium cionae]
MNTCESEHVHGTPTGKENCLVCFDSITEELYVEYKVNEKSEWFPSKFCSNCIEEIQKTQYQKFIRNFTDSDCQREQRRLLLKGPPINLYDQHGFPEAGSQEIHSLWYYDSKQINSAKLKDSVEGEDRKLLWDKMKNFVVQEGLDNSLLEL